MQTTLLGLAIAFILALVAALVGPFFIDWSQFRPQFEAEATRIVGVPVRVVGALDARLLPAPSLQLHGITIGGANDLGRFRAEKLDVEFSLGSLLRGDWRATELTVGGAAIDLGLNAQGRLNLPASTGPFNLGGLAIDRLNLTGRINLHDAASRSTLELSDIAFSGDVRSLAAGAMRGDGNFTRAGTRYPFRISSGQTGDGNGTRLRLVVDASERSPSLDLDGILSFDNRAPNFDGAVTIASGASGKADINLANAPWRIVSKVKADPSQALFESVDVSYGTDDGGLKLAGVADLRFGSSPLLHAVVSAKQLDADRLLAKLDGGDASTPISALRKLTAIIPQPALRTQIEVSIEQIMLGGRPITNVGADLHGDKTSWTVERLEFRAPGVTRVVASGAAQPGSSGFAGAVSIDSADPDILAGWLKGRNDIGLRDQKPLRIRGNFSSNADRLSLDGLKAEIDGGTLEGRIALNYPSAASGSRIDAALRADRLDLDAATALVRSLSGPQAEWPEAGELSLDIGRAISSGHEMRPFAAQLTYSPKTIALDRFKFGEATGLMLDGNGAFDRVDATGRLALNANAPSLAQIGKVIASFAPVAAMRLDTLAAAPGAAKLKLAIDVTRPQKSDRVDARASLDIDAPQVKGALTIKAAPTVAALRGFDGDALSRSEMSLDSRLTGQGGTMLALLGLNGLLAASDAPLTVDASVTGAWRAPMRVKAKLAGSDLDADVQGSVEPSAQASKAAMTLTVRNANAAPLLGLKNADPFAKASLSARVALNGDKLNLDDIDSMIAGSRLRGRMAVALGSEPSIDGQLGADTIDVAPAFGWLIGARGHDAGEPLVGGALRNWRGQLVVQSLRASLPGGVEIQPLNATIKNDGQSLTINGIKGKLGGGDLVADVDLKPTAATGYAVGARVELTGAEGAALRYRGLAGPAGKTSLKMSIASQGRSASALEGAVSGDGLVTIDGLRIASLDPRIFDVAIGASDSGQATNDTKLKQIVEQALGRGEFATGSAQIAFNIKDSRLRVSATTLDAEGARVVVSGGYDIVADQVDIRANLLGSAAAGSNARPEVQLFLMGSPDKLERSTDIASLSSWLAVRAIDRETRRLDLLERGAAQSPAPLPAALPPPRIAPVEVPSLSDVPTSSAPTSPDIPLPRRAPAKAAAPRPMIAPPAVPPVVSQQVAPLPAPIEVRPAPGSMRQLPKQRPSQPLVLTPPAPALPGRPTF